jgi:hypothetical protein
MEKITINMMILRVSSVFNSCITLFIIRLSMAIVVEFGFEAMYAIVDGENHNKYDDFACKHGPNPGLLEPLYDWWVK